MTQNRDVQVVLRRVVQVGLGGAAGLALWALVEIWHRPWMPGWLYLAAFVFLLVLSGTALALAGPFQVRRALGGGLMLALPVTVLASLAARRYGQATDLLDDPVMLAVLAVLVFFASPFLTVWMRDQVEWRSYAALFQAAWTMTVRYAAAWAFVAAFWAVALLSAVLLGLVGITQFEAALAAPWVRYTLTGAMLGMGLAVAYELRRTLNPYLILRLLRLLLPLVLAVVAVFLVAVPFRGLSRLFGEFSAAGPLMATAVVAITLVSTALDRNNAAAVSTPGLRLATRALALLMPLLAGLAVVAVAIRVGQYGWTPDRVLAGCVALFLLAYGLGYSGAAARAGDWAARIRTVNVWMALAVIGGAALWMTPVLESYRISANSQVARYVRHGVAPVDLPLWQMAHEWGRAGLAGVDDLAAAAERSGDADLRDLVVAAREASDPYIFVQAVARRKLPQEAAELAGLMAVRPEGAGPGAAAFAAALAALPAINRELWLAGCRRPLPDGRPGCVLVYGDFAPVPGALAQGIVLFLDDAGQARGNHVLMRTGQDPSVRVVFDPVADTWPALPAEVVAQALDGAFSVAPSGGQALRVGGAVLVPAY